MSCCFCFSGCVSCPSPLVHPPAQPTSARCALTAIRTNSTLRSHRHVHEHSQYVDTCLALVVFISHTFAPTHTTTHMHMHTPTHISPQCLTLLTRNPYHFEHPMSMPVFLSTGTHIFASFDSSTTCYELCSQVRPGSEVVVVCFYKGII